MSARKHRALADLYNVTPALLKPEEEEITPVLIGSFHMQGPLYEPRPDIQANTESSQVHQESNSCSKNQKVVLRAEFGKCDVCSSPCSSCLHIQPGLMGSKLDENSAENSTENPLSCSLNDVPTTNKSRKGETQPVEMSDMLSVNSSCDSVSENAKQKASSRFSDASDASGNVPLPQKVEHSRGSEVLDDNMSCVVSSEILSRTSKYTDTHGDKISLLCSPASTGSLVPEGSAKAPNECVSLGCINKKCDTGDNQKWSGWQSRADEVSLGKVPPISPATDLSSQNLGLVEILSPKNRDGSEHLTKEGKSILQVPESNKLEQDSCQRQLLEQRDAHLNLLLTKEVASNGPRGDTPDFSRKENEDVDKSKKSAILPDGEGISQSHLMDDSDDSEIVEQDVKVCDICGDAGREDLLGICCRCTDGAEHTYCMREMLDKVPEGDWMCEECKYDVEMKNLRQDKIVRGDGNEKGSRKSSGWLACDSKGADEVDRISKDHSHIKILGKRHRDDVEVSSSAKKVAVEPSFGSPKKSNSHIVASLSRDNSFRYMEKGKEKLLHQSSFNALVVSDDAESVHGPATGSRMQMPQGNFLKSNSFSSLNSKPKVKLVDEVVLPKQKLAREHSLLDLKEGSGKSLGKSMSFRNISARLAPSEAKVKMLSPSFPHSQDNKGFKHTKARSLLERKSSFRSERPVISPRIGSAPSVSKSDQKPVGWGANALASISNHHQTKVMQSDSKSSALSKSSSFISHRNSDISVSVGEVKRQSVLANGCKSSEQKSSPKNDPSSVSCIAERPTCSSSETLPDGTPQPRESANCERARDNFSRLRQNVAVCGRTDICQKCKKVGHLTQFCTVEDLPSDLCFVRSSREVANGGNDLKAAIEAARLRKPGICRKNYEAASQDQSLCSSIKKNVPAGETMTLCYSADSCKQAAVDIVKQCTMETSTSGAGDGGAYPLDGKTTIVDVASHSAVFWKVFAIPEHEFIWQGNFEVHTTVNVEAFDGIQAHLSTCASPKVLGAVDTFPNKIVLNKVPRLSAWPIQFQEFGVREDNIALYFFAKDVDSYEKSYKNLLEKMIKDDLALKGIIDGVELLIFPSSQLPEESQRKKKNCLQQAPGSPKQSFKHGNTPTAMPLPENICSVATRDSELPASNDGEGSSGITFVTRRESCQDSDVGQQVVDGMDSTSSSTLQRSSSKPYKELRCTGTPLEGTADSKCKLDTREVQASVQAPGRTVMTRNELMTGKQDTTSGTQEMDPSGNKAHGVVLSKTSNYVYQVNHGKNLGDETAREVHLVIDTMTAEPVLESSSRHLKGFKLPHDDCRVTASETASGGTSQSIEKDFNDEDVIVIGTTSKGQKTSSGLLYGVSDQSRSSTDNLALQRSGSSGLSIGPEANGEASLPKWGNAERYFFPVDPHPVKDIGWVDESMPWKIHSMEEQLHERVPNLELALGGEAKSRGVPSFLVGKVEKKMIQEDHSENVVNREGEDDVIASLSLSLAFPFSENQQNIASSTKSDQLRAEKQTC